MVQDDYIEDRLRSWGDWLLRRESGGLGYPGQAPYVRMQARSGGGYYQPEVDTDAMEIELAVSELPEYLRDTVRQVYVEPGTIEQKIRRLHCGKRALYYRLEHAKEKIKSFLAEKKELTLLH